MHPGLAQRTAQTATAPANQSAGKAKSVIMLWMAGGPCHIDTFDPKPGAGEDYTGPLNRTVQTNVPGILLNASLPLLARQADKFALLRGMTHPSGGHETATYIMQTGTLPTGDLVYPAMGTVVAYKRTQEGTHGPLPPYVTVTDAMRAGSPKRGSSARHISPSPPAATSPRRTSAPTA